MTDLINRLPQTRGEMTALAPMKNHTWFGVGGAAEVMFSPVDHDDLAAFLAATPDDIPLYPIGAGSNLLVRDGGLPGVVINTSTHMKGLSQDGDTLTVGAGIQDMDVARAAAKAGLEGLEFLIGIPGTVGGGLRMNAGAYGAEFKDVTITATALDRNGVVHHATPDDMGMAYRHSGAPSDWIFTQATLQARAGDKDEIRARMKDIVASRGDAQPRGVRTGGSTFANPAPDKAWQLIDAAGCRGLQNGKAMVSDKHCNFLINTGGASARDIEELGENVRARVKANSGVELRWEIRRIGLTPEDMDRQDNGAFHDG
ncbi:MAG: UDP-N-acetylmuramate dehydrogenase [Alphaproteobacteria bacterium]|nr:UDP-N-acetylmuramate dehydrogenase [Alphaproteobacteria bacterium]